MDGLEATVVDNVEKGHRLRGERALAWIPG